MTATILALFLYLVQEVSIRGEAVEEKDQNKKNVLLLVESSISVPLKEELSCLLEDIEEERKYEVSIEVVKKRLPGQIKNILRNTKNLAGCIMIGDIPSVSFEYEWEENGKQERSVFLTDLYYMDLNGYWRDNDEDGIFDEHSGHIEPEIWVGRLKAPASGKSETKLLKYYFNRNHLYRIGAFTFPHRALLYIDDFHRSDGIYIEFVDEFEDDLERVFDHVIVVDDDTTTIATDYARRLKDGWCLVRLIAHGGTDDHHFLVEGENDGKITASEIGSLNPRAFFFLITSCSNFNYEAENCMGGSYVFSKYGLLAIGQTGHHDVLVTLQDVFFDKLNEADFGSAYQEWLIQNLRNGRKDSAMNASLIGDPTLTIKFNGSDLDRDALSNSYEIGNNLDTKTTDSDHDGIDDFEEILLKTDPLLHDTDGDGLRDGKEIEMSLNPLNPDTDNDGIMDDLDPHPLEDEGEILEEILDEACFYLEKAMTEFNDGKYENAKFLFEQAKRKYQELNDKEKMEEVDDWIEKCSTEIRKQEVEREEEEPVIQEFEEPKDEASTSFLLIIIGFLIIMIIRMWNKEDE